MIGEYRFLTNLIAGSFIAMIPFLILFFGSVKKNSPSHVTQHYVGRAPCLDPCRHDARGHARVATAARNGDVVVREGRADLELGDERALAVVAARVLLDEHVAEVGARGREPLEAVNVLEGHLALARVLVVVVVLRRVAAVSVHALAAELDAGADVDLALDVDVRSRDLGRESGEGPGRAGAGARQQVGDASVVINAEVARGRGLDEAVAAVRVGRVVLGLGSRLAAAARVPERIPVRRELLELPRAVLLELLDRAVPLPVDRVERAGDLVQ